MLPDRPHKLLILGGTSDAILLAERLLALGHDVASSLAGVTTSPVLPKGKVRRGGFGGVMGLAQYLREEGITTLIDATHPFAAQISSHAVKAAGLAGVPLLRLERPRWEEQPDWIIVPDIASAVAALPENARVFLTIGRKEIAPFVARADLGGVMRMIEAPPVQLTPEWKLLQGKPAANVEEEASLIRVHHVTHLVSKNSGGPAHHKLVAAAMFGVSVVMIARPLKPLPTIGSVVKTVDEVLHGLSGISS
jgi:precorrin-6A/cobalt-precorrin-6A reductase